MQVREVDAFREFVAARGFALLRTAYVLTGDRQLAEDLVQTALEKAVRHWSSIRSQEAVESYVRRTMYRDQVSVWRGRRIIELPTVSLPEPRTPPGPDGAGEDALEDRVLLRGALMQLSPRQRAVVVLRYFDDLTEDQVADALGVNVGTVKSLGHRALAHLRGSCAGFAPTAERQP